MKKVYIAEKPSVAQEFARVLGIRGTRGDGFLESDDAVVTWCVGHLVTMSYPEVYDPALKSWRMDTLPFIPEHFLYEVIPGVRKQFEIVSKILNREDVDTIYVCTDAGREGEYIYRLVEQLAGVPKTKNRKRVWIDSQTEEEILRGIREAKSLSTYDALSASAYLRAKEDYLMGINFSRLLTLRYGPAISQYLSSKYTVLSIGRVMTCVLGMVVRREREIREFVKTSFYKVQASLCLEGEIFSAEWRVAAESRFNLHPSLYKDNGFTKREYAQELCDRLKSLDPREGEITVLEKKTEKKNAPLLYNLAELQNECSRRLKMNPDETLKMVQTLYEKKMVTYPRTDARVLSSAVAREIEKNIRGLQGYAPCAEFSQQILQTGSYKNIEKTKYTNDSQVTDHYAIIPTGQNTGNAASLGGALGQVYDLIVRRFLSIFFPPARFKKITMVVTVKDVPYLENFHTSFRIPQEEGYLILWKKEGQEEKKDGDEEEVTGGEALAKKLSAYRKGQVIPIDDYLIKEGETKPPSRYNSGSLILAMENAGQFIEEEELRAQIKGSGIGTSATRAEILKKLVTIRYLQLNAKTQIITPTELGELVYEVVNGSMPQMLNPHLTASWEKGLSYVAEGTLTEEAYMEKLTDFIRRRTAGVKRLGPTPQLQARFRYVSSFYRKGKGKDKDK